MPTLAEIASLIGASVPEDRRSLPVEGIASPESALPGHVAFLTHEKYLRRLSATRATAVVVGRTLAAGAAGIVPPGTVLLEVEDPSAAMQAALEHFAPPVPRPAEGVHPTAIVPESVTLGRGVAIGPHVVLGEDVTIGAGTTLHAGVVIGGDVTIGEACEFFPAVVVRERCTIGSRVVIHAGSAIGSDGFGYRWDGRRHAKQPHLGTVVIEDDVEIGSCTCIDRAKVDETRIGAGTKIDNLVQVGHNVRIGRHCILCAGVAIGGTAVLGDGVVLGGGAAVRDHARLGAGVQVAGFTAIPNDVPAGEVVMGVPALPQREFLREQAALRRLPELVKTIRALTARVAELEARQDPREPPAAG